MTRLREELEALKSTLASGAEKAVEEQMAQCQATRAEVENELADEIYAIRKEFELHHFGQVKPDETPEPAPAPELQEEDRTAPDTAYVEPWVRNPNF